ncbi:MAG TPA: hypothetical protein VK484_09220 [Ferruginibacter sp.]|nr:hypothetical protein [Ferruginibacter sp.]
MYKSKVIVTITISFLLLTIGCLLFLLIRKYTDRSIEINQLGDAIGGMIGPLVAVIGTLLVYISFQEQVKANELQTKSVIATLKETKNDRVFNGLLLIVENRIMLINNQTFKFDGIPDKIEFKEVNVKIRDLFKSLSEFKKYKVADKLKIKASDEYRLFGYLEYFHRNVFRIVERTLPEKSAERDLLMNLIWENFSPTWDAVIFCIYGIAANIKEENQDAFETDFIRKTIWWNSYFFSCFSEETGNSLNVEMSKKTTELLELVSKQMNDKV